MNYILIDKESLENRIKEFEKLAETPKIYSQEQRQAFLDISYELMELLNSPTVNIEEIWLAARKQKMNVPLIRYTVKTCKMVDKYPTLNDFLKEKA